MYQEDVLKKAAYDSAKMSTMSTQSNLAGSGAIGRYAVDEACRDSLTDRVRNEFHRSSSESRKADRMNELLHLLEKNPEVARILDLVEEVK